ncbi:MAG: alpha/beta hydrolase, partial [Janthinobacterium lividum]
ALGYATARMNFRGVGDSQGVHDHGAGETDDMEVLRQHMMAEYPGLPLALGGFSFGTFVQSQLQQRLIAAGTPAERLALVGAAAGKWAMPAIPANTILIHGELDETIPLKDVFDWLRPQDIPVVVIPGADHFFHRRLPHIKSLVMSLWQQKGIDP